ncbi:hypothetical protein OIE66_20425 [Nonomuraea sp. NBC_01738]|uniref:hypothetical protein n=1 Tax=Nonomuraea sp. NBC_01738 TaxID=2976003 RepID=UPI002E0DF3C9|nr:hypothetical protein OIE66_20425 [Nonomuraea sp. NBC_01738]
MREHDDLLDAGLAPLGTPDGEPIAARRYRHPHLGERPVIRLAGQTTGEAEDRALAFLGFGAPEVSAPLTTGRVHALGYPAWTLAHDPANARQALAAVTGMQRAARIARTRPGVAAETYAELAAELPRAHLPSFWEEAGRAFIAAAGPGPAAVMFGLAREAETTYALPVDEDARRAVFLEFAFAGALPVKAIAAYAAELETRYEPGRAYAELRELAVRRTLGGLPPWAELPKQVRRLAKAAGLDVRAEDERLVATLLSVPSTRTARLPFWKEYRDALAAQPPELLREVFPTAEGVDEWWLGLLEETGALDGLPAAWLTRQAAHLKRGYGTRGSAVLLRTVPRVAARLAAEGSPCGWKAAATRGASTSSTPTCWTPAWPPACPSPIPRPTPGSGCSAG